VGLLDSILGGKKRLKRASLDQLFALSTARITLDAQLGLKPSGVAAVVYKPMSAGEFGLAADEMKELLHVVARDAGSEVERRTDSYGFEWLTVRDADFEDLITAVHLIASELQAKGFGEQLLAAAFRFDGGEHPVYLIYGFKRAAFWPFVPTGDGQKRDNPEELRLKNELEGELPIEEDLTRWMGLFDAPV
jgi:hypothetical protein